ncbi:uncharacterized protein LOC100880593 [Megachile rotundata]|uniref:uncharacterized protein LOC100880593 n=1 Tax=Megachile rotundata TaxID=143995 RepID=UPI003FD45183
MNALWNIVPWFLAARVAIDSPWEYGPEYTFQVRVNSTAIPEEGSYVSIRLNVTSKLVCQPKGFHVLSCHFRDSKADSYVTETLDPGIPEVPVSQEAYEINQDQFEIKFSEQGLDSLVVNENIQPRELDMIRVIVDQLNIGVLPGKYRETLMALENYTLGECMTDFDVDRNVLDYPTHLNSDYQLLTMFKVKDGQVLQIRKRRHLHMCMHRVPYFFGSAESFREVSDVVSTISSSTSYIVLTSTEFTSGTRNVIITNKVSEGAMTTLYEDISLRLESILPAKGKPPEVKEPEPASMFVGRWLMDKSIEDDLSLEI